MGRGLSDLQRYILREAGTRDRVHPADVLPPRAGVDLFFGGRVTEVFGGREGDVYRAGFTFRTLAGHPKTGEEMFWVEKEAGSGAVRFGARSWSRDATWLSRLASPLVRWLQVRAGRSALRHLRGVAGRPRYARSGTGTYSNTT